MTPRPNFLIAIAIAVAIAAVGGTANAADIKVLTAGAMKSVVVALAPEFEKQTIRAQPNTVCPWNHLLVDIHVS